MAGFIHLRIPEYFATARKFRARSIRCAPEFSS